MALVAALMVLVGAVCAAIFWWVVLGGLND